MIFSVLPNTITTIFLSANLITSMTFKDEVRSFIYGGVKEEVFTELANNNKTLVMKAKIKDIDTNLIIVTSKNRYYFSVKEMDKNPHQFIEVEDGAINSNFRKIKETESYEVFEGVTSLMLVNKSKKPINVNGNEVIDKEYFSKGIPLMIEGHRTLN
jgi:type IV secretory pathway VirB9-like protein